MKSTFYKVILMLLLIVTGLTIKSIAQTTESKITFYKTPLVCSAVPDIGCGSRAKPVLLELEKQPAIKEAWLNRPGTVLAIVWKDADRTEAVAKPVFDENDLSFTRLNEKAATPYRKTFGKENLWYRGADVDMLSREEATRIAGSVIKYALDANLITKDEAEEIKTGIGDYLKGELVKVRNEEQLNNDSQHKFRDSMFNIGVKYIGMERTKKVMELYQKNCKGQSKKNGACTTPGTKKDCCDKS